MLNLLNVIVGLSLHLSILVAVVIIVVVVVVYDDSTATHVCVYCASGL